MQKNSLVEGTSANSKQLQGSHRIGRSHVKSGEFGQNMPREASGTLRATPSAGMERLSSQPFLTDEQRAALDAALAAKQRGQGGEVATLRVGSGSIGSVRGSGGAGAVNGSGDLKAAIKAAQGPRGRRWHDHHENRSTKGSGKTKKGGAGGKYTWGGMLAESEDGVTEDVNDPNYNSDDDGKRAGLPYDFAEHLHFYKQDVVNALEEYFNSGDMPEAAVSLVDLNLPELHHWFVKKAVTMALDKHNKEREMTSALLSYLYNEVISQDQISKGFLALAENVDDTALDVPNAPDLLAKFVARAVVDEVLPPSMISRLPAGPTKEHAELKKACELQLAGKHYAEKLQRIWGCSAGLSLEETRNSIATLLQEYQGSYELGEAERLLRDLNVPFYHHELVKQLVLAAMAHQAQQAPLLALLKRLADSGEVSLSQIAKGFKRIKGNLADVVLDNPHGVAQLQEMVDIGLSQGWLESDWETPSPQAFVTRSSFSLGSPTSTQAFKTAAAGIVKLYFASADAEDAAASLKALGNQQAMDTFVKQAVILSMGRLPWERELLSRLLYHLHPTVLPTSQAESGFSRLLIDTADIVLDCPDGADFLKWFLARAVVDGVLPASFLQSVLGELSDASPGVTIVRAAGAVLGSRGASQEVHNCWGSSERTTACLQTKMKDIVVQYMDGGKAADAQRRLTELGVPPFHHEFIYQALTYSGKGSSDSTHRLLDLLSLLAESGTISQTQMRQGIARVEADLSDSSSDASNAQTRHAEIKQHAETHGWLTN